jgi:hypothetical protein
VVRERLPARLWSPGAYVTLFTLVRRLKRQHASQAAGFVAVTNAAAVLIGGWDGLSTLSNWDSDFATVQQQ